MSLPPDLPLWLRSRRSSPVRMSWAFSGDRKSFARALHRTIEKKAPGCCSCAAGPYDGIGPGGDDRPIVTFHMEHPHVSFVNLAERPVGPVCPRGLTPGPPRRIREPLWKSTKERRQRDGVRVSRISIFPPTQVIGRFWGAGLTNQDPSNWDPKFEPGQLVLYRDPEPESSFPWVFSMLFQDEGRNFRHIIDYRPVPFKPGDLPSWTPEHIHPAGPPPSSSQ